MRVTSAQRQWVGIDVSQAWLDVALRPDSCHWCVANQASGWTELITELT
jgi:transposase